jgi:hypothetical protein
MRSSLTDLVSVQTTMGVFHKGCNLISKSSEYPRYIKNRMSSSAIQCCQRPHSS